MDLIKLFKIIIVLFLFLNFSILILGYSFYNYEINNLNVKTDKKLEILNRKTDEIENLLNIEKRSYEDKKSYVKNYENKYENLNSDLNIKNNSSKSIIETKSNLEKEYLKLKKEAKTLSSDLDTLNILLDEQLLSQRVVKKSTRSS